MGDRILNIGEGGLDTADERVKSMMNNMANSETPGFRRSDVVQNSFPLTLAAAEKKAGTMVPKVESAYYNFAPGALVRTGNPTDIAIGGDGFFVVQAPFGEGYTRDGRFVLNKEGALVSAAGDFPLLGTHGPIVVPPGSRIEISNSGEVKVDNAVVDRIRVALPNKDSLEAVSGSLFRVANPEEEVSEEENPKIIQGYTESSNVSMIDEMMSLVMISHLYAVDAKIVQTRDTDLTKAMDLGKPTQ